jgi:hypothetical protein
MLTAHADSCLAGVRQVLEVLVSILLKIRTFDEDEMAQGASRISYLPVLMVRRATIARANQAFSGCCYGHSLTG